MHEKSSVTWKKKEIPWHSHRNEWSTAASSIGTEWKVIHDISTFEENHLIHNPAAKNSANPSIFLGPTVKKGIQDDIVHVSNK